MYISLYIYIYICVRICMSAGCLWVPGGRVGGQRRGSRGARELVVEAPMLPSKGQAFQTQKKPCKCLHNYIYIYARPPPKIHSCSVSKPLLPNVQEFSIFSNFQRSSPKTLDLPMSTCPNFHRSSPKALDFQTSKFPDFQISKFPDFQLQGSRFPDFQISRCQAPRL